MTGMTVYQGRTDRSLRVRDLAVALLVGVIFGASAAFALMPKETPATEAAAPAVLAPIDGAPSTTAGQQYVDWYSRDSATRPASTTAGEQYRGWYTRPSESAARTTAGEQYQSWYLRESVGR